MSAEELIERQSVEQFERLLKRVGSLESNDYFRPTVGTGVTSNPPSQAEITAILGSPASFNSEMVGLLKDTINNREWFVISDKVLWYFIRVSSTYNVGVSVFIPPVTITSNVSFADGLYTITGVPSVAKAAIITIEIIGSSTGQRVGAYSRLTEAAARKVNVSVVAQNTTIPITASGVVPTRDGNQVYLYRSGAALNDCLITCSGYFI